MGFFVSATTPFSFRKLTPLREVDGILMKNIGVFQAPPTLPMDGRGKGGGEEVRISP
jgi:hypothetical protein